MLIIIKEEFRLFCEKLRQGLVELENTLNEDQDLKDCLCRENHSRPSVTKPTCKFDLKPMQRSLADLVPYLLHPDKIQISFSALRGIRIEETHAGYHLIIQPNGQTKSIGGIAPYNYKSEAKTK